MRILLCIDHFGPGGAQRQLINLGSALTLRGHLVEFFIYHPEHDHFRDRVEQMGAKVIEYEKRRRLSIGPLAALTSHIRRTLPDAVVAFLSTPALYAELASTAVRSVPVVASERFMYTKLTPRLRLQQAFHRLATKITVNSHHQHARMVEHFPWMEKKLAVIYNGIDLESFNPSAVRSPPGSRLRLLAVGNTAPKKNAMGLARGLALLKSEGLPVPQVAWAGAPGAPSDHEAKAAVDSFLLEKELSGFWTWLGRRDDVPALMSTYDALVHPAYYEGLPNAICEALASGLPVLASDVGDHRRLVGEDRGRLFDPHQPSSIAAAISAFSSVSEDEYLGISRRARQYAEENLSLERYGAEYEKLLLGLPGPRSATAGSIGAT